YVFKLVVAIVMGIIAITGAVSLFAAQYPSDIYMNREPVRVLPGQTEHIDWTITFTNTPISYSFSIYDPDSQRLFSRDFPAVGEVSPIISSLDWPVPTQAISGPYVAEVVFFTKEISDPFDSRAAITFIVYEEPTPCFGNLAAYKCEDKNANGVCREPHIDRPLPGVEICLDPAPSGQPACQKTGDDGYARWKNLSCGSYTLNEHLSGLFRGYYPTSPMTKQAQVSQTQTTEITFSNIFPLLPRGIAVNPANDKVYAAFLGIKELDGTRPYPFVAVIDSRTDQVIATIPDVGREPFGVAVSNNKVYVAAFREGAVTVIDSQTDRVIKKISGFVHPTQLAVDPAHNLIYVADPGDGQVRVIDTAADTLAGQLTVSGPTASDPYDVIFSNGLAYTTLRQTPLGSISNPFYVKTTQHPNQIASIPLIYQNQTGSPYAITARTVGANTYLYITYAKEFRDAQPPYQWPSDQPTGPTNRPVNPTQLMVVEVPNGNPAAARRLETDLKLGNFAESGLTFNPNTNHLLGTFGGGFYEPAYPDSLACAL
ncbi:MAG: YncE family protein, partial [Dehalococcoidia bacterium]